MDTWHDPHSSAHDARDEPSAWDYALAAQAAYLKPAVWVAFFGVWLAVALSGVVSGFWAILFTAIVLFILAGISFVILVPILVLQWGLAWLVGLGMRVEDRRKLIVEHQASERREVQSLLANPTAPQRPAHERFLTGLVLGALLGWWWGDD